MASKLVVLVFEGAQTADGMLHLFEDLQEKGLIKLEDAVVASRGTPGVIATVASSDTGPKPTDAPAGGEVEIRQTDSRRGRSAGAGAGIGVLVGLLLGGPIGGAAIGAIVGGMRDRGVDDKFVRQVGEQLRPDTSAIFLLVKEADAEAVLKELEPFKATVLHTDLDPEAEKRLRQTLSK